MTGITPNPNLKTFAQMYGAQPAFNLPATTTQAAAPVNISAPSAPVQSAPAPNLNNNNTLEKTPKSDTITIAGKTIKKKTAIIGGLSVLAATVAVGAAIAFGASRGKAPAGVEVMEAAAEDMSKKAAELTEAVQKKIDNVIELFKNGGKDAEGKVVATIGDGGSLSDKFMEELAEDGTVIRRSLFTDGKLSLIQEYLQDEKMNQIYLKDGMPREYEEGIEILSDGGKKVAKVVDFCDGEWWKCSEGLEYAQGSDVEPVRIAKELTLCHADGHWYREGIQKPSPSLEKVSKEFFAAADGTKSYLEGAEWNDAGQRTAAAKVFEFTNGKWVKVKNNR